MLTPEQAARILALEFQRGNYQSHSNIEGWIGAMVVVAIFLLAVPPWIAYMKRAKHRAGILALTILLGWTFIGWALAIVWAIADEKEPEEAEEEPADQSTEKEPEHVDITHVAHLKQVNSNE